MPSVSGKASSPANLARFRYNPATKTGRPAAAAAKKSVVTKSDIILGSLDGSIPTRDLSKEHEYMNAGFPKTPSARAAYRTPSGKAVPPHHWSVYDATLKIPCGQVTTYKDLCAHIAEGSPRSVGNALRENPFSPYVPCHRVVTSSLFIGGFRGSYTDMKAGAPIADPATWTWEESVKVEGAAPTQGEKVRMLTLEGVQVRRDGKLAEKEGGLVWRFDGV